MIKINTLLTILVSLCYVNVSGQSAVGGCMNPLATNYNEQATWDDGSCIYAGCTDPNAINYNVNAGIDDGSCIYGGGDTIDGCTDTNALNYNPNANYDDGSCIYPVYGCTDPTAINYNPYANVNDGSCIYGGGDIIDGCTDTNALNYNPNANYDNGSCIYPDDSVYGCMDPYSSNYNPYANINTECEYEYLSDTINGCTDTMSINYNPIATYDDSSCIYSYEQEIWGCTDPRAINYNPEATRYGGRCIYSWPERFYRYISMDIPVDTLGNSPIITGNSFFDDNSDSAEIIEYSVSDNILKTKWRVFNNQASNSINQEYTLENQGINLIYLTVVFDSRNLKSANAAIKASTFGYTLSVSDQVTVLQPVSDVQEIIVYPNPARESVSILTSGTVSATQLRLIGADGKIKYSEILYQQKETTIELKNLPQGIYIIQLIDMEGNVISKRFQKI